MKGGKTDEKIYKFSTRNINVTWGSFLDRLSERA